MKHWIFIIILFACFNLSLAQQTNPPIMAYPESVNKTRLRVLQYGTTIGYGVGMYKLAKVWFFNNQSSQFKYVNDFSHWNQMDKIGHMTTANSVAENLYYGMRWAGMSHKKATWKSGITSLLMITGIDVMDGFSTAYGFSWPDVIANSTGVGLVIGQHLLWGEQKMILKWSYRSTEEVALNPADLGDHWSNEWLHNYNGQTYWFTFNANHWLKPEKTWQKVLGLAIGKGAQGMYLETHQLELDSLGGRFSTADRYHQWYLGLDLDLTHIRTKSRLLRTLFSVTRLIKTPLPTLSYDRINGIRFRPFYF